MIAIDTNVLVRLLVEDDVEQCRRAQVVVGGPTRVRILYTVLLEAVWVLTTSYALPTARVAELLRSVLGLPNVSVQANDRVERAFAWAASGVDLADALHLAAAEDCDALVSFDRDFARKALRLNARPPVHAP